MPPLHQRSPDDHRWVPTVTPARGTRGVAVIGTGRAGRELISAVHATTGLELLAGVVRDAAKVGVDLGVLAGRDPVGVVATDDLEAVLRDPAIDVVLHAGLGDAHGVAEALGRIVDAGKDAITVAGLVHPRWALGESGFGRLQERAKRGRARVLGTGVNPGFVLDVLPVVWGSMVSGIEHVSAQRISEIRDWGDGILDELGIGSPVSDVVDRSPLSVAESLAVIADGLALDVDTITETVVPIESAKRRSSGRRTVEIGQCAGFRRTAEARRGDVVVATIEWVAAFQLDVDGLADTARLRISGDCTVEADGRGTFFGDPYPSTAARAIRAIGPLAAQPPGVYRPDQLPVVAP